MSGEMNLQVLLREMEPIRGGNFAFCVIDEGRFRDLAISPLATFREAEGLTVVLPVPEAEQLRLPFSYVGTLITLNVHSNLNAVGFLAKITAKLASAGISLNAFSPFYHDHIFVRPEDANRALELLEELSKEGQ